MTSGHAIYDPRLVDGRNVLIGLPQGCEAWGGAGLWAGQPTG